MDQRDDYAEPYPQPPAKLGAMRRRLLELGIGVLVGVAVGLIVLMSCGKISDRNYYTNLSISRADEAAEACRAYYLNNPNKTYPASLDELCKSFPGFGPFLGDPDEALKDAWGNPLHYALVPNADGELEPYVWAERVRHGKVTLHGAKRTADGQRVFFGLPDD